MPNPATQYLRARMGKVCVAITGGSAAEMVERASGIAKETMFLEFRLDYLAKPLVAMPELQQFLAGNSAVTAVATCRRTGNGGNFAGSVAAELEVLKKAAESGFHVVDLELESAEAVKPGELVKLREAGAALLVSHHNFEGIDDLDAVLARIDRCAPDFIKIVPTAKKLTDNVTLMRFLERAERANLVGICMGDAGIVSRVLGVRAGSLFTFASASVGEETAPGQIAARTLLETYRIDAIDAATKVFGVAGDPVSRSLSPLMMNSAFRRETVNAVYLALQATDVGDLVELVRQVPIQGLSITMPHKQTIMPHLAHTDALSAKIGAVNTVLRAQDGKLYGFNTDVAGIVGPLEKRIALKGAKILVLGAGGAARAAVFGLRDKGAEVFILNRSAEKAAALAKQSGAKVVKREALPKANFDAIVNATPVGMRHIAGEPILSGEELRTKLVFDLVYNPVDTPLLKLARERGIAVITGVEMFIQQGARQFEIWTGRPAPEEEMLRVVVHALKQEAGAGPADVSATVLSDEAVEEAPQSPGAVKKVRVKKKA